MNRLPAWLSALLARLGRKPNPTPPPVPVPPGPDAVQMYAAMCVIWAMNDKPPMNHEPRLTTAAQRHADTMEAVGTMAHSGIGDGDLVDRLRWVGYAYSMAAENIEEGSPDVGSAMKAWMNSPGHRANILGPYRDAGFGRSGDYWCAVFAVPA